VYDAHIHLSIHPWYVVVVAAADGHLNDDDDDDGEVGLGCDPWDGIAIGKRRGTLARRHLPREVLLSTIWWGRAGPVSDAEYHQSVHDDGHHIQPKNYIDCFRKLNAHVIKSKSKLVVVVLQGPPID